MPPIPPPLESGVTTTTPVPLWWGRWGTPGAPRLLVLHGGPGAHHDYLLPQMLALGERHELVFYDQRGGGRSKTDDPAPITWRTHVADLAAVADELGGPALSLVGYSWGGLLALLYALEQRKHLAGPPPRRLLLVDPAPISRGHREAFEAEFARRNASDEVRALRDALAASGLRESDPVAYRQRTFELAVAGYFADPHRAHDLTPFRVTGRVQQQVWESLGPYDLAPRLTELRVPAMIIHGRQDPIPLASSEAAAAALQAELVVLDDCGHVPYVEAHADFVAAAARFLAATDALAAP